MNRLRWWVIPGAMIVLARVVTLGGPDHGAVATPEDAVAVPERVVVQDASGQRVVLSLGELAAQALVIDVPAELAGERVTLTVWRRVDGAREGAAWIDARPRVGSDATLPIAGLQAGRYDVKVVAGDRTFTRDDVAAPGVVTFAASAAPGR